MHTARPAADSDPRRSPQSHDRSCSRPRSTRPLPRTRDRRCLRHRAVGQRAGDRRLAPAGAARVGGARAHQEVVGQQPLDHGGGRRRFVVAESEHARLDRGEVVERRARARRTAPPRAARAPAGRSRCRRSALRRRRGAAPTTCTNSAFGNAEFGISRSAQSRAGSTVERRHRARLARVVARQLPAVVAAAAVGDDVLRHVLDDQILAADAERRLLVRASARRDPTTRPSSPPSRERVQARDRPCRCRPARRSAAAARNPST